MMMNPDIAFYFFIQSQISKSQYDTYGIIWGFFLTKPERVNMILEMKKDEWQNAHTIVFSDTILCPKLILRQPSHTIIALDKTIRNTNVLIGKSIRSHMHNTNYTQIKRKQNGFTIVLEFPPRSEHAPDLYQDIKHILLTELHEQLQHSKKGQGNYEESKDIAACQF